MNQESSSLLTCNDVTVVVTFVTVTNATLSSFLDSKTDIGSFISFLSQLSRLVMQPEKNAFTFSLSLSPSLYLTLSHSSLC